MYEVALCECYYGPASRVIGPFPNRESAAHACTDYNKLDGFSPARAKKWYFAPVGEIPRKKDCVITSTESFNYGLSDV